MDAIAQNMVAQWGAVGAMFLGVIWLVRYFTALLAKRDETIAAMTAELLSAYKQNTAALTSFTEVLRGKAS